MTATHKPILIFPTQIVTSRSKLPSGFGKMVFPSAGRQTSRLRDRFELLTKIFDAHNAELSSTLNPIEPEKVLVLETVGSIDDLMKAVAKVEGLEWLIESASDDIAPDEDFYLESDATAKIQKKLYLMMANKRGLEQFIALWEAYKNDPTAIPHGQGRFKSIFEQLYDVRFWGTKDRLEESCWLEDWIDRVKENGEERVNVQVELWFRNDPNKRAAAETEIRTCVEELAGSVLDSCIISEIEYHGLLVCLPISAIENILSTQQAKLIKSEHLMFFRSAPQGFYRSEIIDPIINDSENRDSQIGVTPHVALLDGLPLENHLLLRDRITVDDWNEWSKDTEVKARKHGTQMASIIVHGDLKSDDHVPLKNKIVIAPILKSVINPDFNSIEEHTPKDKLEIDLIHIAIKRVIENNPTVKIINLSYGDKTRAFYHSLSPLAKLIDWLSYQHNILFVISSGNYPLEGIEFNNAADDILYKIHDDVLKRKIMSPSESLNAITVGALNSDSSGFAATDDVVDILRENYFPSPLSATGLGYKNSVKPDVLMPGGKIYFKKSLRNESQYDLHGHQSENYPPGILSAVTSDGAQLSHIGYCHGTSVSCALTSRLATQINEVLDSMSDFPFDDSYRAILIKAMLCHGASWGDAKDKIFEIFNGAGRAVDRKQIKYILSRIFGYGAITKDKCLFSTDSRAFIIGTGEIKHEQGVIFDVPVPSSIVSLKGRKRITVTLSWFTPLNPSDRRYRMAELWFDPPKINSDPGNDKFARQETEYRMCRRGTLQHEIFETDSAIAFDVNDKFQIQVNCRQVAGKLPDKVRFALAVSLEVEEALEVNVFDEIQTKLAVRVQVTP